MKPSTDPSIKLPVLTLALCALFLIGIAYIAGSSSIVDARMHSSQLAPTHETLTILIGGDIMLDRRIRMLGEKNGYDSLFTGVSGLFHSADISVANLEGPVTANPSLTLNPDGSTNKGLAFTFATSSVSAIKDAGITLVSMANNHSDNMGRAGVIETRHWLGSAGIGWFGDPANDVADASSTEKVICKKGMCVAFIGYHEFQPGFENILADVSRLHDAGDFVIVMPHWGDEYASTAPARIRDKARELVAAGASAIIGSHPHVIEDREWIDGVPVIYSLGNLIFDQYFSPEVMRGNIAEIVLSNGHIDRVRLYTISLAGRAGPVLVGEPIEFPR